LSRKSLTMKSATCNLIVMLLTLGLMCCDSNVVKSSNFEECFSCEKFASLQRDIQEVKTRLDKLQHKVNYFAPNACPPGFTYSSRSNKCYKAIREPLTWINARRKCSSLATGAHLVVVENKVHNDAITEYLQTVNQQEIASCRNYFTSGQRIEENNCNSAFVWKPYDTEYIHKIYTNWNTNEPNCYFGKVEGCIEYRSDGKWNDGPCSELRCSLCEAKAIV